MDKLKAFIQTIKERFGQLSFTQKIMVGTLLLALIISTAFLMTQTHEEYDVLYSNLSVTDAAATVAKLKEAKIPYKLSDGGTTIMVPINQKNDMVLETAGELTGEDTVSLGKIPPIAQGDVQKEWLRKLNTDAIEGVLESINGIKHAKVLISQPEATVFSDEEEIPTASVMLVVEPGFRLREEQVKNVKNLVSHAIPSLKPENVAISDNLGNSLEGMAAGAPGALSDADIRRKRFEDETRKKVLAILEPVVGKNNAVVSVSAALNFNHTQAEIHRVIPEGGTKENPTGLIVSAQEQLEEMSGEKQKAEGGAVGTETNTAPSYVAEEDGKKNDYKMLKKTTNYAHSEERKSVVYAPGAIERLTVSVILNKVLTNNESEEIKEAVATAAGVDYNRGDAVDVKGFQFSSPPGDDAKKLAEAFKAEQEQEAIIQYTYMGTVLVLGLAAMFFLYKLLKQPAEGEIYEDVQEEEEEEYPMIEEQDELQELIDETPVPLLEAKLDPELEHMREAINTVIVADPSEAARLLTAFMKDSN